MRREWEQAEEMVASRTGGKRTPGSGNGYNKGDIYTVDREGLDWAYEVKDTSQEVLTLNYKWFTELERDCGKLKELALIIRWKQEFIVYTRTDCYNKLQESWKTKSIRFMEDLPGMVYTPNGKWILTDFEQFLLLF